MAVFKYSDIREQYKDFEHPVANVIVSGNEFWNEKKDLAVSNIVVDLSAGFEASQAVFEIYNVWDSIAGQFNYDKIKKYILIGSPVIIKTGYDKYVKEIFRGVICRVNFVVEQDLIPHVAVTAMDIKAIMMANHYHKQLTAKTWSAAVKEIFDQSIYANLKGDDNIYKAVTITNTPDAEGGGGSNDQETDFTIEMVGESDYEFVVRVAKKFNYEFFVVLGEIFFRKAKSDTAVLVKLDQYTRFFNLDAGYDITGLVQKVEVRGLDVGKGSMVSATVKNDNAISTGGKAKGMINGSTYVYVDPTVTTKEDAQRRAAYLLEDMSYRLGTLEMDLYGFPELLPGRIIEVGDFGKGVDNTYYLYNVSHRLNDNGKYVTHIVAKAASVKSS